MYTLPPPLLLRNAVDGDDAFCRDLYASTRDDLRQLPFPPETIESLIAMQHRVHEQGRQANFPDAEVLILEHDGIPTGRAVLAAAGPAWRLVDIAVHPGLRGRGFAHAMLLALQGRAATADAGISLAVARTNAVALRLYEQAGFAITGGNEMHYEMMWRPG